MEPTFFEIPIYRCSFKKYVENMEMEEKKIVNNIPKSSFPETNELLLNHFHSNLWYCWQYNEVIGYLNLYIFGSQFRADTYFITKKRINKGIIKKKYKNYGKTFEKQIPRNLDSKGIFSFILDTLNTVKERDFNKFHFDLRALKVIGEYVDWSKLTNELNSFSYPHIRTKYNSFE